MEKAKAESIANQWMEIMGNNTMAIPVMYEAEWYVVTKNTGEGIFCYDISEMSAWCDLWEGEEKKKYPYEDFCDSISPIVGPLSLIRYINEKLQLSLDQHGTCCAILAMAYCHGGCDCLICTDSRIVPDDEVIWEGGEAYCKACWDAMQEEEID